ncbi:MAG: phage minor head protein [Nitrosomonadaceae bacterium]
MPNEVGYTREKIDDVISKIHAGVLSAITLPQDLYAATVERLVDAVFDGFGATFEDDLPDPTRVKMAEFHRNVQVFSGAKTHQFALQATDFIFDEAGNRRSFGAFKALTEQLFETQYDHWLRVEMNTAANTSAGAQEWFDSQRDKEAFSLRQYQTVGDERVRPTHVVLDNIIKHVDDPFWDTFWPPNGWNCRCTTIGLEEDEATPSTLTVKDFRDDDQLPSKLFNRNPGKSKFVFVEDGPDKHPFFKVEDRFEVLKNNNFNLPLDDRT